MGDVIQQIEAEQQRTDLPEFAPGDTVLVQVRVTEGGRERLQPFEGVVIAKRNRGINSAFTVRKMTHGEGVERVFQTHSPTLAKVEVKRRGKVRRAKLYYLRGRTGKAARIKERTPKGKAKKASKKKASKKKATAKKSASKKTASKKKTAAKKTASKKTASKKKTAAKSGGSDS